MIDLKQVSGFGLKLDEKANVLIFGARLRKIVPGVRTLENMERVLLYPEAEGPERVYFMYRSIVERQGIRYDITVIPPGFLGREYVKTLGHYHPPAGGMEGGPSYPEVYEVLHGEAVYLLQKRKEGKDMALEDFVVVRARPGQKVLIPPGYGHVTVNAGSEALVMSNLVYSDFRSVYEPYLEARGAGYYVLREGEFKKNKKYTRVPKIREANPQSIPVLGLRDKPLYLIFRQDPRIFEYLKNPARYGNALVWF